MMTINNNRDHDINRGVELILKRRREKENSKLKDKKINFEKIFSLFKREIKINFEISILKKY